jgi:uncharacterized protein YycO
MVELVFTDSDSLTARFIRAFTWSKYCHVGLYDRKNGLVIDSRSDRKGVTAYKFEDLKKDYSRILIRSLPSVPREALEIARSQIGKPYDWTALAGLGLHRDWQESDKWFCSELVIWACEQTGAQVINKQSWRVTPQDVLEVSSAGLFE